MKRIVVRIAVTALSAALSTPVHVFANPQSEGRQTRYTIVDLGVVGNAPGGPYQIANNGLVAGAAANPDGTERAVLWYRGLKLDVSSPGLGGLNSAAYGVNERAETVGAAQTHDFNEEDFCGFNAYGLPPANSACVPFLWKNGAMASLPTLGGPNGYANRINARGEVVGLAETNAQEQNCQVFQFKPVVWKNGIPHQLPTVSGDPDGVAAWINDKGQIVGASGTCGSFNPNSGLYLVENHALLWENGNAIDLGNLGGMGGDAGNHACAINNHGQIVGHSELAGDVTFHAFLWTKQTKIQDLGTLDGDYASLAIAINDEGTIVGGSLDANFNPRASVWQNGIITDLNTVIRGSSPLYLLLAFAVNDSGEIVGFGATTSGEIHGFVAVPARP